jgi:hypothetical protein
MLLKALTLALLVIAIRCQVPGRAELAGDALARAVVEQAYLRLSLYSGGQEGITFELADFQTSRPETFDQIRWIDLATLGDGDVIDVAIERRRGTARYKGRWDSGDSALTAEDQERYGEATLASIIATEQGKMPALRDIVAVTTYTVRANLAGKSRRYRAAFLWRHAPSRQATE